MKALMTLAAIIALSIPITAQTPRRVAVIQDTKGYTYALYSDNTWERTDTPLKSEVMANWTKLSVGMQESKVRKVLGDPARTETTITGMIRWTYPNGGVIEMSPRDLITTKKGVIAWTPPAD